MAIGVSGRRLGMKSNLKEELSPVYKSLNRLSYDVQLIISVNRDAFLKVDNFRLLFDDAWPGIRSKLVDAYEKAKLNEIKKV